MSLLRRQTFRATASASPELPQRSVPEPGWRSSRRTPSTSTPIAGASASPARSRPRASASSADPRTTPPPSRSRTSRCSRAACRGSTWPGLQDKMVRQRRGGYCFEQNTLFRAVLQAIGFEAQPMEARIRSGVPADVVTGRTHLATRVVLDGVDHLVDVGCGGIAPLAPLALAAATSRPRAPASTASSTSATNCCCRRAPATAGTDGYRCCPARRTPIDCEMGNWFVATHPEVDAGPQPARGPRDRGRPAAPVQPPPVDLPARKRRAGRTGAADPRRVRRRAGRRLRPGHGAGRPRRGDGGAGPPAAGAERWTSSSATPRCWRSIACWRRPRARAAATCCW